MKKNIGDIRTFNRYLGKWKIIDIIENKNIQFDLILKKIKCPSCGNMIGEKKKYIFNHIELLQEGQRKMYLGISDCGRYIVFREYLSEEEIKNVIEKN